MRRRDPAENDVTRLRAPGWVELDDPYQIDGPAMRTSSLPTFSPVNSMFTERQAVTNWHSIKAVQAQLGHRSEQSTHLYAHLGSRAQLRLVEGLQPAAAPHGTLRAPDKKKGT